MILKDFSILRLRNMFRMASFEKKMYPARSENRESGPTASVKNVCIIDVS